jgi:hypothetical protein
MKAISQPLYGESAATLLAASTGLAVLLSSRSTLAAKGCVPNRLLHCIPNTSHKDQLHWRL